ncbi:uncharacterized protein LOC114713541 [Neltuma alba]|uniref:uncharacterized protein LOC114713541 n=1 Tax=Neltuma alba TaxID=207710 RepID=UPI0010A49E62|nr:uncharacterized protein LOC114713541 [Prosopis alba]
MGTEVFRLQAKSIQHRFRREASAPATLRKSSQRNCGYHSRRRLQSPIAVQAMHHDRCQSRLCNQSPGPNLVKGDVKILKRGEKLIFDSGCLAVGASSEKHSAEAKNEKDLDLVLESTDRPGRIPETMQNHVQVDSEVEKYAGPAFHASPSPSLVPVPRLLRKKLRPSVT